MLFKGDGPSFAFGSIHISLPCSGVLLPSSWPMTSSFSPFTFLVRFCSACYSHFQSFLLSFLLVQWLFIPSCPLLLALMSPRFVLFLLVTRLTVGFLGRQCLLFPLLMLGCFCCIGNPVPGLSIHWYSPSFWVRILFFLCSLPGVFLYPLCYAGFSAIASTAYCFALTWSFLVLCRYRSDSVTLALLVFLVGGAPFLLSLCLSATSLVRSFFFLGFLRQLYFLAAFFSGYYILLPATVLAGLYMRFSRSSFVLFLHDCFLRSNPLPLPCGYYRAPIVRLGDLPVFRYVLPLPP